MQARLLPATLLMLLSIGSVSLMAQRSESFGGSIDKRNVATANGQTITVERETDAASPILYQAFSTKEMLPKVIFKVYKPGDPTKYKIITLENAVITKAGKGTKQPGTAKPNTDTHEKEEIAFTFTKISVAFFGGSTSVAAKPQPFQIICEKNLGSRLAAHIFVAD